MCLLADFLGKHAIAIDRNLISQTQYDEIWEDNVLRWLFGDDKVEAEKLIQKIHS